MQFSQVLKSLMDSRGLSNYQLAKDLDIHPTTVANWLDGKLPRKKTQLDLATYFDVPIDYLMGSEQKERPARGNVQVRDEHDNIVVLDDETRDIIDSLRSRPDMKMLFSVSKGATPEDIITAVKIIEALKNKGEGDR